MTLVEIVIFSLKEIYAEMLNALISREETKQLLCLNLYNMSELTEINPMEYLPIGTIGIYENIHVKVMPSGDSVCIECAFNQLNCSGIRCSPQRRRDHIGIVFKRIE